MRKTVFLPLLAAFWIPVLGPFLGAQTNFSRGEDFFMQNKPGEAVPFLENALLENPDEIRAYLYLGIAYQQLERPDDAVAVYLKALPKAGNETARIACNLGNLYFGMEKSDSAEHYYTQAIEADPSYAAAYLNRANTRIKTGAFREALPDYDFFLSLEPRSPKRLQIEQLVALIRSEFAAEERRRLLAEEAARAEAARRQRLLEEVSASLQAAAEETKGLSSGAEAVQSYEGEFELE
ncbi:MAG: tetratricopeptide repeat protein [Treponema sp.]|nr:tetratricopeptide repeat protein [Treponema sp.]